jgi:arylsulfatase
LLDVAGVTAPASLDGVPQQPITGISMRYSFNEPNSPSHRTEQVFTVAGNLSFYKDGWVVASRQAATPWDRAKAPYLAIDQRSWELYDVRSDFSEAHDLAASNPVKLAQMKDLYWVAAARANILPLHPDEGGQAGRPYLSEGRTIFEYGPEVSHVPAGAAPEAVNRSFAITADVVIPENGANGVLVADGGRFSGYTLFLDQGRLTFTYNGTAPRVYRIVSSTRVPAGRHRLAADFQYAGGIGGPATLVLTLDGKEVARGRVEHSNPVLISHTEGLDVGEDSVSPVDPSYSVESSKFTGQIERLTISLK